MEIGLIGLWFAAFVGLALLGWPVSAWLFAGMDHDALAFPLSLATLGIVGHLVGQIAFGWPAGLAGVLVLGAAAAWTVRRVALDWRSFGEAVVVFAAAFLFMVGIRALDPAAAPLPIAIGEKMLDYGLVRSLGRAPTLPPEDLWFAGRPVRYHYGGHMLTALIAALTGTHARFAYNLGLAGFYAILVTTAYGLAGSIVAPYDVSRRAAAGFGAFFVGLAGNLETSMKVLIWLLPAGLDGWLARGLGYDPAVLRWSPGDFFYFDASRVFPIDPTATDTFDAATEFPLFAWLNGDLHAHMMSQPFMLLAVAVLLAAWRTTGPRRRWLLFGALPPIAGLIGLVNAWSFPSIAGLTALVVVFQPGDPRDLVSGWIPALEPIVARFGPRDHWLAEEGRRIGVAVIVTVAVLALGILWTLPYWLEVVIGGPGRTPGLWGRWTGFGGLLRVHGAFLAMLWMYLAGAAALASGASERLWAAGLGLLGVGLLVGVPVVGLVLPLGLGAWWLLRTQDGVGYELVLVLAGAGLVLLVEVVTVEGDRFNTVFKYYAHVWLFWSIASGVALARLWAGWPDGTPSFSPPRWRAVGRGLAAVVVVMTAVYAGFALPAHVSNPGPPVPTTGPTLDATAYLDTEFPREAPAIMWLEGREGRPTIVTAAPGGYWWRPDQGDGSSAPSSLTGLPTVLGWFHERQYRGFNPYQQRVQHVHAIYTGPAERQRTLLARYDVRYIYVGPAERATYSDISIDELDAVTVAERWDAVTIYRVNVSTR